MQELNARHSASVAAKLDALKQQQQAQGQQGSPGPPPGQRRDTRQVPKRSLSPNSDFWRQSQRQAQQSASQNLQEVRACC